MKPLDLHTCYTPWPVFRDVTDGTEHNTSLAVTRQSSRGYARQAAWSDGAAEATSPGHNTYQRQLVAEDHTSIHALIAHGSRVIQLKPQIMSLSQRSTVCARGCG